MARLSQFHGENKKQNIAEEDLMSKFDEYKNLNQAQLNQKLFEEVSRQKREGSFDYQALENMLEAIKGNLSENDYQNVKRMLELLK